MRISKMFICCIKNELGIDTFPCINMYSVRAKRQWRNYSPEQRAAVCEAYSKAATLLHKRSDKKIKLMKKGMKKYWANLKGKARESHIKKISIGMKAAWDNADENFNSRADKLFEKRVKIIHDVPRINTYSGVITESQMEEISI